MAPDSGHGADVSRRRKRARRLFDTKAPTAAPDHRIERVVEARDGTRLYVEAWHDALADKTALVLLDGLGCDGFAWKYLVPALRGERPILHPHYRGHGRSEVPRDLSTLRIATMVDDLERVLDAAGVQAAVFLGHSMGIQILLEAHRRLAARMAGLVLVCGTYERPIDTWHNAPEREAPPTVLNRVMRRIFPQLSGAFLENPGVAQPLWTALMASRFATAVAVLGELNPSLVKRADFAPYMQHLGRMDMRVFAALARELNAHSAGDVLPTVTAPTLVVGGGKDTFAPAWISDEMHRRIPGSELLIIDGGSHATPIEQPMLLQLRLEKFLTERVERAAARTPSPARRERRDRRAKR